MTSGHCGAFHYPPKTLGDKQVKRELRAWLEALSPSEAHIAMAPPAGNAMEAALLVGIPEDQARLTDWVSRVAHLDPATSHVTHPRMICSEEAFTVTERSPFSGEAGHDLQQLSPGRYEDRNGLAFDLYGKHRT